MSKKDAFNLPVIEWSTSRVVAYNPQSRQYAKGANIAEIAPHLGGAKEVVVAVSRRNSFVRTLNVPDVNKAQAAQVVRVQLGNLIPVQTGDIAFDFRMSKQVGSEGRFAVLGAIQTSILRQIFRDLKAAGLSTKHVVPAAFGSWLLAKSLDLPECAVVEHVPEGLAIDIISGDELRYTRTVPMPQNSEGIEAEICRTFSIAKVPCAHIVASGGLAFPGADTPVTPRPIEIFATGLLSRLDMNIEMPETILARESKQAQSRSRIAMLLWLAALAYASLVFVDWSDAAAKVKADNDKWNSRTSQLKRTSDGLKGQLATATALETRLSAAFQPVQSMSDIVYAFSNKVPTDKLWISGFTLERGKLLMIRGTSLDSNTVAAYVQALAIDPRFRDVKLVFANNGTLDNNTVVEFSISAHVVGNLPLDTTGAGK